MVKGKIDLRTNPNGWIDHLISRSKVAEEAKNNTVY